MVKYVIQGEKKMKQVIANVGVYTKLSKRLNVHGFHDVSDIKLTDDGDCIVTIVLDNGSKASASISEFVEVTTSDDVIQRVKEQNKSDKFVLVTMSIMIIIFLIFVFIAKG